MERDGTEMESYQCLGCGGRMRTSDCHCVFCICALKSEAHMCSCVYARVFVYICMLVQIIVIYVPSMLCSLSQGIAIARECA